MQRSLYLVILVAALTVTTIPAPAQQPDTVETVVARAGQYVQTVSRQLAGMIAEEDYTQEVRRPSMTDLGAGQRTSGFAAISRPQSHGEGYRHLRSDLVLVRPNGADTLSLFRDIHEVDSRPVHDRSDRLAKLFLQPTSSTTSQLQAIVMEGQTYELGEYVRTFGVPMRPLVALEPANQARFKFKRTGNITEGVPLTREYAFPKDTWVIQYNEAKPPAILRSGDDKDLLMHGRLWIEPASGRVLLGEVVVDSRNLKGRILVRYEPYPALNVLAPAEMSEQYEGDSDSPTTTRVAAYTKLRHFQVDESFTVRGR